MESTSSAFSQASTGASESLRAALFRMRRARKPLKQSDARSTSWAKLLQTTTRSRSIATGTRLSRKFSQESKQTIAFAQESIETQREPESLGDESSGF